MRKDISSARNRLIGLNLSSINASTEIGIFLFPERKRKPTENNAAATSLFMRLEFSWLSNNGFYAVTVVRFSRRQ